MIRPTASEALTTPCHPTPVHRYENLERTILLLPESYSPSFSCNHSGPGMDPNVVC